MNLFCFAYAGGSVSIFNKWRNLVSSSIRIVPIEIPGRGSRYNEPLCDDMDLLIDKIYGEIRPQINEQEYSLYGHSMGSWIVYYLLCRIVENGDRMPVGLYLSGKEAPFIHKSNIKFHELERNEFIRRIYNLGGTPLELLKNKELLSIYLPILKNDYKLVETCQYKKPVQKGHMNITIFNGIDDDLTADDLYGWKIYTDGEFEIFNFDGGHFFIHDHAKQMLGIIEDQMNKKIKICS